MVSGTIDLLFFGFCCFIENVPASANVRPRKAENTEHNCYLSGTFFGQRIYNCKKFWFSNPPRRTFWCRKYFALLCWPQGTLRYWFQFCVSFLVGEATAGVVAAVKSGASMTEESSMTSLFWFMQYWIKRSLTIFEGIMKVRVNFPK